MGPSTFCVIGLGLTLSSVMTYYAKWRLGRCAPELVNRALTPGSIGLIGSWLLIYGVSSSTLLNQLSLSAGAMVMCVSFGIGLRLCLFYPDPIPPGDDGLEHPEHWPVYTPATTRSQTFHCNRKQRANRRRISADRTTSASVEFSFKEKLS